MRHVKKWESMAMCKLKKKKSTETVSEEVPVLYFLDKDFKSATIIIYKDLKEPCLKKKSKNDYNIGVQRRGKNTVEK